MIIDAIISILDGVSWLAALSMLGLCCIFLLPLIKVIFIALYGIFFVDLPEFIKKVFNKTK